MNYDDELERSRARRSRKRETTAERRARLSAEDEEEYLYESGSELDESYEAEPPRIILADEREAQRRRIAERRKNAEHSYHADDGRLRTEKRGGAQERRSRYSEEDKSWEVLTHSSSRGGGTRSAGGKRSGIAGAGGGRSAGRTGAKNRKKSGKSQKKKIIIGAAAGVFALLLIVVGVAYGYINHLFGMADQNEFDEKKVANPNITIADRERMEEGFWTIAVFGLDSRDGSTGKGNQSDVIMIVNIDRKTGEIKLASVFRDTYLNISEKNTYNKINAAYAQGGPEQAVAALNKNLDLNITDYATFNWKAVATAVNILGGVDIEISKAEHYYINAFITETVKGTGIGSVQIPQPGMIHMDGVQAVAYGRLRLMDTDYARTERQKIVIQKAFEKAKKADLQTLNSLVGNMFSMCSTNIGFGDVAAMVPNVSKYHLGESTGFPMARDEKSIKIGSRRSSCVVPQTLESNVISLHEFLFGEAGYKPSGTVKSISNKIAEISGLYDAGKEAGPVRTDQGYVPKATTAAAPKTTRTEASKESEEESEQSSESSESSSESSSGAEGSAESESGSQGTGNSRPDTEMPSETTRPQSPYETTAKPDNRNPSSPMDMTTAPGTGGTGPGFEPTVPEATMSPGGPASQATNPDTSVILPPTAPVSQIPSDNPAGNTGNGLSGNTPAGNSPTGNTNTPAGNSPVGNTPAGNPAAGSAPGGTGGPTSVNP